MAEAVPLRSLTPEQAKVAKAKVADSNVVEF